MFYSLAIFTCRKDSSDAKGGADDWSLKNWQDVFRDSSIVEFEEEVSFAQMVKDVESDTDADILMHADADVIFDKRSVWNLVDRVCEQDPKELRVDFLMLGRQSGGSACYLFRRGMFHDLPSEVTVHDVDSLAEYCLARNVPVIDASLVLSTQPLSQNSAGESTPLPASHILLRDGMIVAKKECSRFNRMSP